GPLARRGGGWGGATSRFPRPPAVFGQARPPVAASAAAPAVPCRKLRREMPAVSVVLIFVMTLFPLWFGHPAGARPDLLIPLPRRVAAVFSLPDRRERHRFQ